MDLLQIEDETQVAEAPGLTLTPAASVRVNALIQEKNLEGYALRVFISGGGCSGMSYGMALDGEPREDDLRFSFDDVDVIVDPVSMGYLSGSIIDYVDDLMGGGFRVENPNAVSSCGCGHSFKTESSAGAGHAHAAGGACC